VAGIIFGSTLIPLRIFLNGADKTDRSKTLLGAAALAYPSWGDLQGVIRLIKNNLNFRLCGNDQYQAKRLREFHLRRCSSPKYDNSGTGNTSPSHSAQGRYGGTDTVPSVIVPELCISDQKEKGIPETTKRWGESVLIF